MRRKGIEVALADLAAHGVTSAQDYSPAGKFSDLRRPGKRRQTDGAHFRVVAV
jgi:hypothetical protein